MTIPPRTLDHIVLTVRDLEAAKNRFEALGFTVTPKAQHLWGTANRVVQLPGGSFIEIITVERPELVESFGRGLPSGALDFGAFNQNYLAEREGFSMLVLTGQDCAADKADFATIGGHPAFEFERQTTLPDGSAAKVAFSLAFASDPALPNCGFFTCHNHFPDVFWKPAFQSHANGATDIARVVMAAPNPAQHEAFLAHFTGQPASPIEGGLRFPLVGRELLVVEPDRINDLFPGHSVKHDGAHFVGIQIMGSSVVDEDLFGMLLATAR